MHAGAQSEQLLYNPPPKPKIQAPDYLVHIHTLSSQIRSRKVNLLHQLCMCLGHIVEGKHPPAEFEEEVRAEGDKGPEW